MGTTVHFQEEDRRRADFIKEQGDYSSRTEAVRAVLKQYEEWLRKQQLREKYSQQQPLAEEAETASDEAFESLGDY